VQSQLVAAEKPVVVIFIVILLGRAVDMLKAYIA
jgi:hypothetical protein